MLWDTLILISQILFRMNSMNIETQGRCSVVGELSYSFASKWFGLVVLKSAIVNYTIEKVKNSPRRYFRSHTWKKDYRQQKASDALGFSGDTQNYHICQHIFISSVRLHSTFSSKRFFRCAYFLFSEVANVIFTCFLRLSMLLNRQPGSWWAETGFMHRCQSFFVFL